MFKVLGKNSPAYFFSPIVTFYSWVDLPWRTFEKELIKKEDYESLRKCVKHRDFMMPVIKRRSNHYIRRYGLPSLKQHVAHMKWIQAKMIEIGEEKKERKWLAQVFGNQDLWHIIRCFVGLNVY